eukprot:TRINITY_DN18526_c0_g1::TRINITY_DN18526_c0_g1_i1::g.2832::m.2832 TRINITY_DN18526_c0_g1::TRINITY_DN18526_c0_g1_i1::g.2832  ORF type:complete len:238 (-),score=-38.03,Cyclotide/PF03784.8/1.1e+02,Cyclotide/PF03784.8/13 TRINITY_DN18526_c0_g1_i1:113-826(-)
MMMMMNHCLIWIWVWIWTVRMMILVRMKMESTQATIVMLMMMRMFNMTCILRTYLMMIWTKALRMYSPAANLDQKRIRRISLLLLMIVMMVMMIAVIVMTMMIRMKRTCLTLRMVMIMMMMITRLIVMMMESGAMVMTMTMKVIALLVIIVRMMVTYQAVKRRVRPRAKQRTKVTGNVRIRKAVIGPLGHISRLPCGESWKLKARMLSRSTPSCAEQCVGISIGCLRPTSRSFSRSF